MDSKSDGTGSSPPANEGVTPRAAIDRILLSKYDQRRKLASLPFEEKFRLVAEMRKLSDEAVGADTVRGLCDLTVRTYVILHRSLRALFSREAGERDLPHWMTVGVLAAFVFEAYLNHVGAGLVPTWSDLERKLGYQQKLVMICERIKLDPQKIISRHVGEVFRFRDVVAHGKTQTRTVVLPNNVTMGFLDEMCFAFEPLRSANLGTVSRWVSTVEDSIRYIHSAYVPEARARGLKESDDPFELMTHGPIYMGTPPK